MEPISIISVIYAFNCFTNSSMKGRMIDVNWHLALSFWFKKIKVTLESHAKKAVIFWEFCLWVHPKKNEKYAVLVSFCRALTDTKREYFKANSNNSWCQKWKEINSSFLRVPKLQPATQIYHQWPCPFPRLAFTYGKIINLYHFTLKKVNCWFFITSFLITRVF